MAKGVEDTALYPLLPLVALKEGSAAPRVASVGPYEFHALRRSGTSVTRCNARVAEHRPQRAGDVTRALGAISLHARRMGRARPQLATDRRRHDDPTGVPSADARRRSAIVPSRLEQYLEKASAARRNTSWIDPGRATRGGAVRSLSARHYTRTRRSRRLRDR